jgi:hypothetical protein
MRSKVKLFRVQGEPMDPPIMLQANHFRPHYDEHPLVYISLQMNNKHLNRCMLDSRESANVMVLKVMRQLGLEVTRPCKNVFRIESRAIPVHGVIENVKVFLGQYPEIVFLMDIVVIDVPNFGGMILYRKFVAMLHGTLQWI